MTNLQELDETDGGALDEKRIDLDDFFPYVGEYGKYQKLLTWLIVLPACIPCGLQGFNQLFMGEDIPHYCRLPTFLTSNTNFTKEQLKTLAIPKDLKDNSTSSCLVRNVTWSELEFFKKLEEMNWNDGNDSIEEMTRIGTEQDFEALLEEIESSKGGVIGCPDGWEYDVLEGHLHHSIVKDFDLVCGYEIYPTIALLLFNIAGVVGAFLFGILTDLIGRKYSFFVCLTFEMIGGIGCVFANNFWIWTAFRVLIGLTVPAIYQIPFIIYDRSSNKFCLFAPFFSGKIDILPFVWDDMSTLIFTGLELVGQNYRSFLTVMTCLFYVGGMMLLPLISYLEQDWRLLSLYTTVPFLTYFIYLKFLPESPRWLLAQKRTKEAVEILEKLAKVNGTELPEKLKERLSLQNEKKDECIPKEKPGIKDLFRTPNLRLKTCLLTFCWFANATVYVGLSFYGPSLGENAHLSFFLGSAVELPGYLLCWLVMDRWGRRWPLCLAMIIGGIFDIATVLLPQDSDMLLMIFYLVAKFGISASYLIVYPFAGELYPTEVRGLGLGFSAYIGGIGICCIPLINYLGRAHLVIPLVIMGLVSVAGGLAALRLPETLNSTLPTTIEEGEQFGKDFKLKDCWKCGGNSIPSSPSSSLMEDGLRLTGEARNEDSPAKQQPQHIQLTLLRKKMSLKSEELNLGSEDDVTEGTSQDQGLRDEEAHELSPLRGNELRRTTSRRKRLVRQGTSTMEAPMDSKGAIMITPWW